jgi:hypothetical protein
MIDAVLYRMKFHAQPARSSSVRSYAGGLGFYIEGRANGETSAVK